jgi:YegS/Rv2252/BmrU family lipid kinase
VLYRRAVLIYNPAAGRRRDRRRLEINRALQAVAAQVESVTAWPTDEPHAATRLARRACESGVDLVLACGGDGTINEVVNGLAGSEVTLGVLPAGTANVLALEVGLPLDPVEAARRLADLEPHRLSLGRICCAGAPPGGRYFLLMAGAGVDAQIVYSLDPGRKARLGILAYFLAGAAEVGRRKPVFTVETGEARYECSFALAANCAEYGGRLRIASGAHLLDTPLELVLFHTRSRFRYLVYLGAVLAGALPRLTDVTVLKVTNLRLSADGPLHVQVDGEYAGPLPATIEIVPAALTLLLPREYVRGHG